MVDGLGGGKRPPSFAFGSPSRPISLFICNWSGAC